MKNNSVKLWEEYIEYAVLAVAILVLAWFAWGAFGTSIEVKVGKRVVTTTTVDDDLIEVAKGIAPKQSDNAQSPMEIIAPDPLGVTFSNRASKNVSPNPKVVFPALDMSANVNKDQEILAELVLYATPIIASPEDVRARQWFGTIRDSELDRVERLARCCRWPTLRFLLGFKWTLRLISTQWLKLSKFLQMTCKQFQIDGTTVERIFWIFRFSAKGCKRVFGLSQKQFPCYQGIFNIEIEWKKEQSTQAKKKKSFTIYAADCKEKLRDQRTIFAKTISRLKMI